MDGGDHLYRVLWFSVCVCVLVQARREQRQLAHFHAASVVDRRRKPRLVPQSSLLSANRGTSFGSDSLRANGHVVLRRGRTWQQVRLARSNP